MSKKNLARTVIEGGRVASFKFERRESNRVERMSARNVLRMIRVNPELADDLPIPERDGLFVDFADKLAPAYRWLAKKGLGMTVEEIRGLLLRTFNVHRTAGRHLVFDHLMPRNYGVEWITSATDRAFDERGVMVRREAPARPRRATKKLRIRARQWLATIAPNERIGRSNGILFLFTATDHFHYVACKDRWCQNRTMAYRLIDGRYKYVPFAHQTKALDGTHEVPVHYVLKYRPVRPLTADETALWPAIMNVARRDHDLDRNP